MSYPTGSGGIAWQCRKSGQGAGIGNSHYPAKTGPAVTAGRYTVTIPAGASRENTQVTVRIQEADGTVGCELLPHGLTFLIPVKLSMDLTGTSFSAADPVTIYWYDTSAKRWVDVGGTFNTTTLVVATELPHFSSYKAGRAGW